MTKQPLVNAETEKRTRIVGMKWKKLGEDKDPEFDQLYLLCNENEIGQSEHVYELGKLHAITNQDAKYMIESRFTHYLEIKAPGE